MRKIILIIGVICLFSIAPAFSQNETKTLKDANVKQNATVRSLEGTELRKVDTPVAKTHLEKTANPTNAREYKEALERKQVKSSQEGHAVTPTTDGTQKEQKTMRSTANSSSSNALEKERTPISNVEREKMIQERRTKKEQKRMGQTH